jgi:Zn-dependent protease with chaperone function
MKRLKSVTAVALSALVCPGTGQLYNRHYLKGFLLILSFLGVGLYLIYRLMVLGVDLASSLVVEDVLSLIEKSQADSARFLLTGLALAGIWLVGVVDAYRNARKRETP